MIFVSLLPILTKLHLDRYSNLVFVSSQEETTCCATFPRETNNGSTVFALLQSKLSIWHFAKADTAGNVRPNLLPLQELKECLQVPL